MTDRCALCLLPACPRPFLCHQGRCWIEHLGSGCDCQTWILHPAASSTSPSYREVTRLNVGFGACERVPRPAFAHVELIGANCWRNWSRPSFCDSCRTKQPLHWADSCTYADLPLFRWARAWIWPLQIRSTESDCFECCRSISWAGRRCRWLRAKLHFAGDWSWLTPLVAESHERLSLVTAWLRPSCPQRCSESRTSYLLEAALLDQIRALRQCWSFGDH